MFDLPTQCAVCRGWSVERLCVDCRQRHAASRPRCIGCAMPLPVGVGRCGACIAQPMPMSQVVATVDYGFPWNGLVAAFKFHAALDLADAMVRLMADAVRHGGAPLPELVLPVPLGIERQAERGMNQAWELARRIGPRLQRPAQADLLLRRFETPHLAALPRDERERAIRGAFVLAPGAATRLQGRSLALVDDVMTTGATAAEASRTLLAAGAASVQLWVFARTP